MNAIAIAHAYRFTHFSGKKTSKTGPPEELTTTQKVSTLFLGINNPRPENSALPKTIFTTIRLKSNKLIECWNIPKEGARGTVIVFHGYGGDKSSMLDKAEIFHELGYNTFIVDFMGSGGSDGNQTTIGYHEAQQVKTSYEYIADTGEKNIYLFGTSMGAVSIMKALNDHQLKPRGIIIECPFGSMTETVNARFRSMGVPTFPMSGLLVFWGGAINGFWAFKHNPRKYAREITCPTLLLYGAKDKKVSRKEIDDIYKNLGGPKHLKVYPEAGHENYLISNKEVWISDVTQFLNGK